MSCIWVDIKFNGEKIRIYNVHLASNKITNKTEEIIEERDFNDEKAIEDVKFVLGSYINSARARRQEMQLLQKHIKTCPYPVVVAGDFNDTPQSFVHQEMMRNDFCDSFNEQGSGLGYTYGGLLPLLRIDYGFVDKHFEVLSHEVMRGKYSDHYPIKVGVRMK